MICPDWRGERLPLEHSTLYSVQLVPPPANMPDFAALFGQERDHPQERVAAGTA